MRIGVEPGERRPGRRHGGEQGALGGHRIVDLSSFWAGPLASRLLAELGADVVKVEPPGGEGGFQMMPVLPNIYVDGNRSKRGLVLDLKAPTDRARLLDLVAASDVVVENAVAGVWERLGLDEAALRAVNPALVYARAKGFGSVGPLASRPSFDYVVQAATGMEMTQGGGRAPVAGNVVVNDYGTGLLLAAGIVCALLGRARGAAVTTVEASLAVTATLYQAADVARLAAGGAAAGDVDQVGAPELRGPSVGRRLYRAKDGWVVGVLRDVVGRGAPGDGGGSGRAGGGRGRRGGGGGRDHDGGGGARSLAGLGCPGGRERAPLRRARRPSGGGQGPPAPVPAPGGGTVRAGGDPAVAVGGRAGGQGPGSDAGGGAAAGGPETGGAVKIDSGLGAELPKVGRPGGGGRSGRAGLRLGGRDDERPVPVADAGGRALDVGAARDRGGHRLRPQPDEPGLHDEPAAGVLGRAGRAWGWARRCDGTSSSGSP